MNIFHVVYIHRKNNVERFINEPEDDYCEETFRRDIISEFTDLGHRVLSIKKFWLDEEDLEEVAEFNKRMEKSKRSGDFYFLITYADSPNKPERMAMSLILKESPETLKENIIKNSDRKILEIKEVTKDVWLFNKEDNLI
jgi:endo-alpha-1,4-polygalactosaminidase (GH114 family)